MRTLPLLLLLAFTPVAHADPIACVTHDSAQLTARECGGPDAPAPLVPVCSWVETFTGYESWTMVCVALPPG